MSETQAMFYHIPSKGTMTPLANLEEAIKASKHDGYVWFNFYQPTLDDLTTLIEPLGLHPLAIEDCLDDNQIPKIEDYPNHTFILFNAYQFIDQELTIQEVDFIIGKKFLITVSGHGKQSQPILAEVDRWVERSIGDAQQGPAFLAHVLLDIIVDQKFVAIEALEEQLNDAEDVILADHTSFHPAVLMHLRRQLLALRKSLFHEREILIKISRRDSQFITEKAVLYYRDIYDHLAKFFELTESSREIVSSLMEMYLSMLNNQMTKAANETNITVRRLTFITTIFMPLTLLAGIGGMSEYSMMTGSQNWRLAYPAFLLAMVVLGAANYYLLVWSEKKRQERAKQHPDEDGI
jgi:magnesium transporter